LHRWIFASAFVLLRPNKPNSQIPPPKPSKNKRNDSVRADDTVAAYTSAPTLSDTKKHEKRGKRLFESIEDEQSRKKIKSVEFTDIPIPVRKPVITPNIGRIRRRILGYLEVYGQADFDEASALEGMEKELGVISPLLNGTRFPQGFPAVFGAWLTYRYTVLATKMDAAATPHQGLSKMDRKVKRMRLVTALRVARDDFMATGNKAVPANVVMITGTARLTNASGADANDFLKTIKHGFEKLDAQLAELATSIGDLHNGKWVVMG
jgi:hypothetical protein